jgi:anti-sigma factor (TIGR02949 family)
MPDEIRSIDCTTAVSKLWDYLDQELDDARMLEVHQHIESCSACLPHADFGRRFLQALNRARSRHLTPPAVRSQVMAALAADGFKQA